MFRPLLVTVLLCAPAAGQPPSPRDRLFPPLPSRDAFIRQHLEHVRQWIKSTEEDIEWFEKQLQTDPIPSPALAKKMRDTIAFLRADLEELKEHELEVEADLGIRRVPLAPMPRARLAPLAPSPAKSGPTEVAIGPFPDGESPHRTAKANRQGFCHLIEE